MIPALSRHASIALLCFLSGLVAPATVSAKLPAVTETRPVETYHEVVVSGVFLVEWTPGEPTLRITAEPALLPHIIATVEDGRLVIKTDEFLKSAGEIRVELAGPPLATVETRGVVKLTAKGLTDTLRRISVSGTSQATVSGRTERLAAEVSGVSLLEAKSLIVEHMAIVVGGTSNATVNATASLQAAIHGVSRLNYAGNPAKTDLNVHGVSSAIRLP
jgi:hypothetical protein